MPNSKKLFKCQTLFQQTQACYCLLPFALGLTPERGHSPIWLSLEQAMMYHFRGSLCLGARATQGALVSGSEIPRLAK